MGVIIGAGTTVVIGGGGNPTQVSWNVNPNIQRAYILGDWDPYIGGEVKSPTETLNITMYSPGPLYPTTPTITCVDANTLAASVNPAGCSLGDVSPTSTNWFVTSYSYSKSDARQPATESWAMMNYVTLGDAAVVLPDYVLRGISEGSITTSQGGGTDSGDAQSTTGVSFTDSPDAEDSVGSTGSVSAGQIGRADFQYSNVVVAVGGSDSNSGQIEQGSCSMPYTPLYGVN